MGHCFHSTLATASATCSGNLPVAGAWVLKLCHSPAGGQLATYLVAQPTGRAEHAGTVRKIQGGQIQPFSLTG